MYSYASSADEDGAISRGTTNYGYLGCSHQQHEKYVLKSLVGTFK